MRPTQRSITTGNCQISRVYMGAMNLGPAHSAPPLDADADPSGLRSVPPSPAALTLRQTASFTALEHLRPTQRRHPFVAAVLTVDAEGVAPVRYPARLS